jgi:hypothetical protein
MEARTSICEKALRRHMKNFRKRLQSEFRLTQDETGKLQRVKKGATQSTFRVNMGGYHFLVPAVKMKQAKEYIRKEHGTFLFFHGNSAFRIKRVK